MNEAVDRLLSERAALDRGFSRGLAVSGLAHGLIVVTAVVGPLLFPRKPLIHVVEGFVVQLPPGGGGAPSLEPPAPAPPAAQPPAPEPPKPEPPPKVLKPPKEEPKKGLPPLESKKSRKPTKATPTPGRAAAAAGSASGTGRSPQTPGIEFGPPGPGVPGGIDPFGDWYLAAVQRKIWTIWTQQIRTGMIEPVTVRFSIVADGSVEDVEVVQSSGAYLLDTAAQRAVTTAAPFSPLPKHYETNRITIQAIFKPTS